MAGGIFTNRPFEANPKCILIGIIMIILYWFLPRRNIFLLPVIFIAVYVLIAWYDWMYDCSTKMFTGTSTPVGMADSIFKPQRRKGDPRTYPRDRYLLPDQEKKYLKNVYWFHLIFIVPLLTYVGWYGRAADPRVFGALLATAGIAGAYHGTRLFIAPRETAP